MGQEGFSSDSSLLYHRYLPTAIVAAEAYDAAGLTRDRRTGRSSPGTCAPTSSTPAGADAVLGRQHLLANDDCRISLRGRRPAVAALPQRDRRRVPVRRVRLGRGSRPTFGVARRRPPATT